MPQKSAPRGKPREDACIRAATTAGERAAVAAASYIGNKGYTIPLKALSAEQAEAVKADLIARPFAPPTAMVKPQGFPIYRESSKKLYVPRFYGIGALGAAGGQRLDPGEDIDVPFAGSMRPYQVDIVHSYMTKAAGADGCGLLEIPCGRGKCLARGTKVRMYDGQLKAVEDVADGDLVLGDDFQPRYVWGTTSGRSPLYTVRHEPLPGAPPEAPQPRDYTVNDAHILTLWNTHTGTVDDIEIGDLLYMIRTQGREHVFGKYRGVMATYDYMQGHVRYYHTRLTDLRADGEGDYFGFCIDGNRRFLLGDGTVTHNTVMALNIISLLRKKTLVVVHKEFLLNQWIERIEQFLPSARVGRIQGKTLDVEGKDIVIGMLQSLSMKDYPQSVFAPFGLTIIDEVHHISAEVFCRSLFKLVTPYMLGLSATMNRKDGLTGVFKQFLGPIVHSEKREDDMPVKIRAVRYEVDDPAFNEVEYNFRGQTNYAVMIRKLCEYEPRSEFVLTMLREALDYSRTLNEEGRPQQIMILAHNKSVLKYLHDAVRDRGIASVGYYVGGMKEAALKETEGKTVVIATYAMAEEALDIKTLSGLILVTPKTDVTQAVGRILRMRHDNPFVIDIVDAHEVFRRQYLKRVAFYRKCKYDILETSSRAYGEFQRAYGASADAPACTYDDELWTLKPLRTRRKPCGGRGQKAGSDDVEVDLRSDRERLMEDVCAF
jgi:superfamily II DNA or RNA helicase